MTFQKPTSNTTKTSMGGPQAPVRVTKVKTAMGGSGYAPPRVIKHAS